MPTTDLSQNGAPRLFFWLLKQRFTGLVHIPRLPELGPGTIWLRAGLPWYTDLKFNDALLGELMVRKQLITSEVLNAALMRLAAQPGQRLGEILLENQILTPEQLGIALAYQCERKLTHLFQASAGNIEIVPQEHQIGQNDGLTQGVNALHLVMQGVRQYWPINRIRAASKLPVGQSVTVSSSFEKYARHFGLRAEEQDAVEAIRAGWNVSHSDSTVQLETVAFVLWNCEMLRTLEVPASASTPPADAGRITLAGPSAANQQHPSLHKIPSRHRKQENDTPDGHQAEQKFRREFLSELEAVEMLIAREANAFVLFDLPLSTDRNQVRKRWNILSRKYHPDALAVVGLGDLRTRVQRVFAYISAAYQTLNDKEKRESLRSSIESGQEGSSDDAAQVVRRTLEAEVLARDAEKLVKNHQYQRALELFQKAEDMHAGEPDVLAGLAWCRYHVGERSDEAASTAITELQAINKNHPQCANGHYYLGLILTQRGQTAGAIGAFSLALKVNPRMLDAERQLRALRSQRQEAAPPKKRGLFGRKR